MNTQTSWPRRYAAHTTTRTAIALTALGVLLTFGGVFISVLGYFAWTMQDTWAPLAAGLVTTLIGPACLYAGYRSYRFGEDRELVLEPDGFRVVTKSRHAGEREACYAWADVIATRYSERTQKQGKSHRLVKRFALDTAAGEVFAASDSMPRFQQLIADVNELTPHLPYHWAPQGGLSVHIGGPTAGRVQFVQTARVVTAQPV